MAKKRANGEGNIRKRKDGRWEGRYTAGYDSKTGKRIIKNVLGKTQADVKEKLKKALEECRGLDVSRSEEYTVHSELTKLLDVKYCVDRALSAREDEGRETRLLSKGYSDRT